MKNRLLASFVALVLTSATLMGLSSPAHAEIGQVDTSFTNPETGDVVRTMTRLASGKYLVGGAFDQYAGHTVSKIVRLNADGSYDSTFATGVVNGPIWTITELPDQKIMIGGNFTLVDSNSYPRIARLEANGTLDSSYTSIDLNRPSGDSHVSSIVTMPDGSMYVGGWFSRIGSGGGAITANGLVKLNASGIQLPFANVAFNESETINQVQLYQGKLLVVGQFTSPRSRVAVVDLDGNLDSSFVDRTIDGTVRAARILTDGKIMIGGEFSTVDGHTYSRLARLNANGTVDTTMTNPAITGGLGGGIYSIIDSPAAGGKLLIAGDFGQVGTHVSRGAAEITSDGVAVTSFADPQIADPAAPTSYEATVTSVVSAGDGTGKLYVMGYLGYIGAQPYQMIGRLFGPPPPPPTPLPTPGHPTVSSIAFKGAGKIGIVTEPGADTSTIQYRTRATKSGAKFGEWKTAAGSSFQLAVNLRKGRWIEVRGANPDAVSTPVKTLVKATGTAGVRFRGDVVRACTMPVIHGLSYDSARRASVSFSAARQSCGAYRSSVNGTTFSKWRKLQRGTTSVKSQALKAGKTGALQIRAGANLATIYLYYPR